MKVCILEHPRIPSEAHFNDIANTPLWSCLLGGYAAARLQADGHHVCCLDAAAWDFDRARQAVLAASCDLVCVNAVYFWEHTRLLFDFFEDLRAGGFDGHLNLFGFFPTLAWAPILAEAAAVDSVAVGECEHTLAALAAGLERGAPVAAIAGLALRTGGRAVLESRRPPEIHLDDFPFPLRPTGVGGTASILASRGCYNHCSFCPVPVFYNQGPLWRGRSPANVAAEIHQLVRRGVRDFYFTDPNFIGPGRQGRRRTLDLMRRLQPLEITFGMETRANDLDAELLAAMSAAGFKSLLMGIESGSARILGRLDKRANGESSVRAIGLCRDFGIEPEVGFLMFVPDSTLADIAANLAFLENNRLLDRLERTANLLSHYQIVMRGTSGYQRFADQGRLTPQGLFGFEGRIHYADPRVRWLADQAIFTCLAVLREMGRAGSPVYWAKAGDGPAAQKLNDWLVARFKDLLETARSNAALPAGEEIRAGMAADLNRQLAPIAG